MHPQNKSWQSILIQMFASILLTEKPNKYSKDNICSHHHVNEKIDFMKILLSIIVYDRYIMYRLEQRLFHIHHFHNNHGIIYLLNALSLTRLAPPCDLL